MTEQKKESRIEVIVPNCYGEDVAAVYDGHMERVKDWALFIDHDVTILRPEWYEICEYVVNKAGDDVGWISAVANRAFCPDQRRTPPGNHDDMVGHLQFSNSLYMINKNKAIEAETGIPFSGFFMLTSKKTWEDVGGFKAGGIDIGVGYYKKLAAKDYKFQIMPGLYVYNPYDRREIYEDKKTSVITYEKPIIRDEKLSVCMMMKNEEKHLKRCLDSVKDIADEIVIVDTGSTDKSMEIAKEYNAKIYEHPWQEDFSLHRNQSIKYATGDWLLFIDADEELCGDTHELKDWLKAVPDEFPAVSVTMKDMQQGSERLQFSPTKIFRKGRVHYKNIVHNQPVYEGPNVYCERIFYKHYGYDVPQDKRKDKVKRSLTLLKRRLEKNPLDYSAMFYISQMYGWIEEWEEMTKYAEMYLSHKDAIDETEHFDKSIYFSAIRIYLINMKQPNDAKRWLDIAMRELPEDLDIAFAGCEFGVHTQNAELIAVSANKFMQLFMEFDKTRGDRGSHFTHCYTSEALTYCMFHLGAIQLGQTTITYSKMNEVLKSCDESFRAGTIENLRKVLNERGLDFAQQQAQPQLKQAA